MAQRGVSPQLDLQQLQVEAQHRWLRPAEICEILRNYQKFQIASEPPTRPPGGSLFLFDRKILRYFRKDGHNWRKKKDGKTVKEAHEKLKVGSIDVLHCYYAHGQDNEHFQRRSYWMLEQDQHIVFVHYLEVKGNRTNLDGIKEHATSMSSSEKGSRLSYSFNVNSSATPSGNTDSTSPTSTLTALCEDADSGEIRQASPGYSLLPSLPKQNVSVMSSMDVASFNSHFSHPSPENPRSLPGGVFSPNIVTDGSRSRADEISAQKSLGLASWEDILKSTALPTNGSTSSSHISPTVVLGQENLFKSDFFGEDAAVNEPLNASGPFRPNLQINSENNSIRAATWAMDPSLGLDLAYVPDTRFLENDASLEQDVSNSFIARRLLSDGEESLKKVDSFSRWVSRELGEVENLQMRSTSGLSWSTAECENAVDESSLSPSISQDQLFSIADFSPKWAYPDSEIEVLITGTFLKNPREVMECNWSCMFGEVEVPTRVLCDGVLSCRAPIHSIGVVPFYITCSNRLASSEVREFDYRAGSAKAVDAREVYGGSMYEMHLHMQLERLLSFPRISTMSISWEGTIEKHITISRLILLKEEEENSQVLETLPETTSPNYTKWQVLQILLKEKLYAWLLHKVTEDGKGPCSLDEKGQGVLHLAVSLGYDWAIKPVLVGGVSINFRDSNGWTALHWAAFCGREQTVAVLVSLGADPGLLSDPSPEYPLGRTPADLASDNGNKGISGFLAESSLTSYLTKLTVDDPKGSPSHISGAAIHTLSERSATPLSCYGEAPDDLSLKDSLTAVCNATQAADRIYQMFRIQSFQRKQLEYSDDESEFDERAISLATIKNRKGYPANGLFHTAATQIQKKFRGWTKRKEFLTIRQRVVKIQARWRGHQVRKQYRTIIWSVGILEKVILRWRRKGSGLRGYKEPTPPPQPQAPLPAKEEDDYDFLKEGRKQTEERLQKALTRVKSMVQYPDARAQYRRLLTVVEGIRENKASKMVLGSSTEDMGEGETYNDNEMLDIDSLLDDDALLMSMTFD